MVCKTSNDDGLTFHTITYSTEIGVQFGLKGGLNEWLPVLGAEYDVKVVLY